MSKQLTKQEQTKRKNLAFLGIGLILFVGSLVSDIDTYVIIGIIIAAILGPIVIALNIKKKLKGVFV